MIIESHAHLHDPKFDDDRSAMLDRARQVGVGAFLTLGDNLRASRAAIALAESHPDVFAAAGIHPSNAESWDEECAVELRNLLQHPRVAVLGEIGLDYYWRKDPAFVEQQKRCFGDQLTIARELGFPVSIHTRESTEDVVTILENEHTGVSNPGVLHCFLGTEEQARRALALGFLIGVGGVVTYPKSQELRDMLAAIGPDSLMVETDAPYLPPQPYRGKRNEPAHLPAVTQKLAEIFSCSEAEIRTITSRNAERFLARCLSVA